MKHHLNMLRAYHATGWHNVNVNEVHEESLTTDEKVAKAITYVYGSMQFVYFIVIICIGWMFWQGYFARMPFDPYPFAFLLFIGNIIQLLGGPILQVGQNLQAKHSELRAESDHHINEKNFEILESIRVRLDELNKEISIVNKFFVLLKEENDEEI